MHSRRYVLCLMVLSLAFSSWAAAWEATITATAGSKVRILTFGADPGASDGFDDLDTHYPPRRPNQPEPIPLDAVFLINHDLFPRLTRDIKQAAVVNQWQLNALSETGDIELTWDISGVPWDKSMFLWILDGPGGQPVGDPVDMRVDDHLDLKEIGKEHYLALEAVTIVFIVDDLGDTDDGDPYVPGDGTNTLRKCIRLANETPGPNTIEFAVSGPMSPTSPLPPITDDGTVIDASSRWIGTWPSGQPGITLDGNDAGADAAGLAIIGASDCHIRGLFITEFQGDGVLISGGGQFNTIGGTDAGYRNVISGNGGHGAAISGLGTNNNVVSGNYIGTDVSGTAALGNSITGVEIKEGAQFNIIGGTSAGERNIISGNHTWCGVNIQDSGTDSNIVSGNYIGTDVTGTADLGNGQGNGVVIWNGAQSNTIGGTTESERNIISGNDNSGVNIQGSGTDNNKVSGNYIGTDVTGTVALGNGHFGVVIWNGAQSNTIGGTTESERNIISGNDTWCGVIIQDSGTDNNRVSGNYIGTDVTGTAALGNPTAGVHVKWGAQFNIIGGTTEGERNIISGNGGHGIGIWGSGTNNNKVSGNYIGTDVSGTADLGNSESGIWIWDEAQSNTIGGTTEGERNVISGNGGHGVDIRGSGTNNNVVSGNYIGTDVTGTADLGNSSCGVFMGEGAQSNTIGGTTAGERNIISGNDNNGVGIYDSGTNNNVVSGNYIGTDVNGTNDLGNSNFGVRTKSEGGVQSNTISGNTIAFGLVGIVCEGDSSPTITDNVITENSVTGLGIGGIVCVSSSAPTITDNTITGNSVAGDGGGGIGCIGNSSPTITNNIITGNWVTGFGAGGIGCAENSSPTITNNIITGNSAGDGVGGIGCAGGSSLVITNNTIVANSVTGSGAGGIYGMDSTTLTITNTILWNNGSQEIYLDPSSEIIVSYSDVKGGWEGEGNIKADPLFEDAGSDNYRLSNYSPCIGAGTSVGAPTEDIEGNTRPDPDGSNPDMGAYENSLGAPSPHSINLTSPDGGEVWAGGSQRDITWETIGPGIIYIQLLYSTDSGITWETDGNPNIIAVDAEDDGIHTWTIPEGLNSSMMRVKAIAEDSVHTPLAEDTSNSDFTIDSTAPTIISTVPSEEDYHNAPLEVDFSITFSEPMDEESVIIDTLMVLEDLDNGVSVGPFSLQDLENLDWVSASLTLGDVLTITSQYRLTSKTKYRITVTDLKAADIAGNLLDISETEFEFTTIQGTHYVDDDAVPGGNGSSQRPFQRIQDGINVAVDGDTVLVADGTYTGAGNVNLDFGGKAITVKSESGAEKCIIDCENAARGFHFHSQETEDSVVDGFTIRNGKAEVDSGGGIICDHSSPTIANNIITGNSAQYGGGIGCGFSSPTITNNAITGNWVTGPASGGGGIYCHSSSATITNNTITGNSATGGQLAPGMGGGIACDSSSSLTITNTILWDNNPQGIYFLAVGAPNTVTISYSDIQGGQAGIITNDNGTVNWGDGNINADPVFVDAANDDYHLSIYSPCIGAGTMWIDYDGDGVIDPDEVVAPATDIEGNTRPDPDDSNPDMGAYENPLPEPLPGEVTVGPFTYKQNVDWCLFLGGTSGTTVTIDGLDIQPGDVVGAFVDADENDDSVNDLCIGAVEVTIPGMFPMFGAHGDDPFSPEKDGAAPGEFVHFKIWDQSDDRITYAVATGDTSWVSMFLVLYKNIGLAAFSGISADASGVKKDEFAEDIYGRVFLGLKPTTQYDVYVVDDKSDWADGDVLSRVAGSETSFTTDASGNMAAGTLFYSYPAIGDYDIVIDVNGDGDYDVHIDYLDDKVQVGARVRNPIITATAGEHGSISPSGMVQVSYGADQIFTITPDPFYEIDSLEVDGIPAGAVTEYTFENVTNDHTISVTFRIIDTTAPSILSTVPPVGSVDVPLEVDFSIAFSEAMNQTSVLDSLVELRDLTTGDKLGPISLQGLVSKGLVSASFNGSGDVLTITSSIALNPGTKYRIVIADLKATDLAGNPLDVSQTEFSFTTITITHVITATAGANGTIDPSGAVTVGDGASQKFIVTPNSCYHTEDVLVDGASVLSDVIIDPQTGVGTYTFSNVVSDHTINVTFAIDVFVITATAGNNGSISPSGEVKVSCGADQKFIVTPDEHYYILDVLVDGDSVMGDVVVDEATGAGTYTFTNVTANRTIEATFAAKPPPVVSGIPDVRFNRNGSDSSIDLDDYVTDPDNTDADMDWTFSGNTDVNVDIDDTTHVVTFTASTDWTGSETITFIATDPDGLWDSDTMTVTVNAPPVVSGIPDVRFNRNGSDSSIDLDDYVTDPDNTDADMDWTCSGSKNVNVDIDDTTHVVTFTASTDWTGSETITFIATDPDGLWDSDTMTVTVNAPPVAVDDAYSVNKDETLTVPAPGVLGNDTDADNDALTAGLVSDVSNGTLHYLHTDGSFSYTADPGFTLEDSFTYKANDGVSESNEATVTINIPPEIESTIPPQKDYRNLPLVVDLVRITFSEPMDPESVYSTEMQLKSENPGQTRDNVSLQLLASMGLVSLSFDGSGKILTITLTSPIALSLSTTYRITITDLRATDMAGNLLHVQETQLFNRTNDPPIAYPDAYDIDEDESLYISAGTGVLANDTDENEDVLTAALVSNVSNGDLTLNADGSFTYTPYSDYNGTDSFTYRAYDGSDYSEIATVTITVNSVNDPPVADEQSVGTDEDIPVAITLTASDVDEDPLTFAVVSEPTYGSLSGTAPNLTYTPDADYNGSDSFTFKANDGELDSNIASVSIAVGLANDPPVADDQSVSTDEDTPVAITLTASDVDEDPLTFAVVSSPLHGSLSGTAPNLTYTPDADYNGSDSFTFRANDGTADSNTATVSIIVNPVNDPPVADDQSVSTDEDIPVAITLAASDVDEDPLTFAVVSEPEHGSLSGTAPDLTYTPDADYNGSDSFTFKANDGIADSNTATVSITVTPVNDPPVADEQSVSTDEDIPVTITLTASDVDEDPLTFTVVSEPAHGSLSGTAPDLTYTPDVDYIGADSFTFKASDGTADSNIAEVTITVFDITPPETTATLDGTTGYNGWYRTPVQVTLSATDGGTGVDITRYRIDNGDWQNYFSPFTIGTDGEYTIQYYSVDNAGNQEDAKSEIVRIDTARPDTEISLSGTEGDYDWYVTEVRARLSASDNESGIGRTRYRLDSGRWRDYSSRFTIDTEGEHEIEYYSEDRAGNTERTDSERVKIDTTAPDAELTLSADEGDNDWYTSDVVLDIESSDSVSGVRLEHIRVGTGSWRTPPVTIGTEGTHTVEFYARDRAGNESSRGSVSVKLDQSAPSPPQISSSTHDEDVWSSNNSPEFLWTEPLDVSGVAGYSYELDNNPFTVPDETIDSDATSTSYEALADGDNWYLHVRAKDNAGWWGDADHFGPIKISTTFPISVISSTGEQGENGWYKTPVQVDFSVTYSGLGVVTVRYRIDDGDWQDFSLPLTMDVDGEHTIEHYSLDDAGNESGIESVVVNIDQSAPSPPQITSSTHVVDTWSNNNSPEFSWTEPPDVSGIAGYSYELNNDPLTVPDETVDGNTTSMSYEALADADNWYFHVKAKDNAGWWGDAGHFGPIKISTVLPISVISLTGEQGENGWYKTPVQVDFSVTYGGLGVVTVRYRIDGGDWQDFSLPLIMDVDGEHTIEHYSLDDAGNQSSPESVIVKIDQSAPPPPQISSSTHVVDTWSNNNSPEFSWTEALDISGIAGFSCELDNNPLTIPDETIDESISSDTDSTTSSDETAGGSISISKSYEALADSDNWYFHVKAKDNAGWWSDIGHFGPVKIDTTPPASDIPLTGEEGENGWYKTPVEVALSATDTGSGVAVTKYTIDGSDWQDYSSEFTIDSDGEHTVEYYSVDNIGNQEEVKSVTIKIDTVLPETTISLSGTEGLDDWYLTEVEVTLSANDNQSGVELTKYRVDSGNWQNYSSPFTIADGEHAIEYHSIDMAGNTEAIKSETVKVDTEEPITTLSLPAPDPEGWYILPVEVTLSVQDTVSGVELTEYRIDDGSWQGYSVPFAIDEYGECTVEHYSRDKAGNEEQVKADTINLEPPPPRTTIDLSGKEGDNGWYVSSVTVTFSAEATVFEVDVTRYQIDRGPWRDYTDPIEIDRDDKYTIEYYSIDIEGNQERAKSETVKIDTEPPTTTLDFSGTKGNNDWYVTPVVVTFSAEDDNRHLSGVDVTRYRIDRSGWQKVETRHAVSLPVTIDEDGEHTIEYYSEDEAGNQEDTESSTFKIDHTPPPEPTISSSTHSADEWTDNDSPSFSWTEPADTSGISGYSYILDNEPSTIPDEESEGSLLQKEYTNITDGGWYFHVRAQDNAGNWGDTGHLGPLYIDKTPPDEVTDLSSTSHVPEVLSSDDTVDVTWTPADDRGSGLDGYSVLWDTTPDTLPDETKDIEELVTELSSDQLSEGTDYYFHIRSVDSVGNWCNTAVHSGPFRVDITPPTLVGSLSSTSHQIETWSSDTIVQLTWEPATDELSGLKGYSVLWDDQPDTIPDDTVEIGPEETRHAVSLPDGENHHFHIRSIDNAGNASVEAAHIGAFYIDTAGPALVTDLTSSSHQVDVWSGDDTVDVQWTSAVDHPSSGLDGYSIVWDDQPDTTPDDVKDIEEDITTATSPNLTGGTGFYFHIRSVDNLGNWSDDAAHLGAFLIDTSNPLGVTELQSTTHIIGEWSSTRIVRVSWDSAVDNESGLGGYSVVWDTLPDTLPVESVSLGADVTEAESQELSDSGSHYFHIRSVDNVGNRCDTAVHIGPFRIDTTPPTLVGSLSSTSHQIGIWSSYTRVHLTWDPGTDEMSGLKGYSILWDREPDTVPDDTVEIDPDVTAYADVELPDGEDHYLHIRSVDNVGNASVDAAHIGPFHIDTTGLVVDLMSPSHHIGVWSSDDTVDVQWTSAVDQPISGLDGYSIVWDDQPDTIPDDIKDIEEDITTATSPSLASGMRFYFHIRSVDNLGNWSDDAAHLGSFLIDTSNPLGVTELQSTTHSIGEWSSTRIVRVSWNAAVDNESGLGGYSVVWDTLPDTLPEETVNLGADVTEAESQELSDGDSHYFHIRSVDNVGNRCDTAVHSGPFYVDATPPALALSSSSHEVDAWSDRDIVTVEIGAEDELSGVKGYSIVWDSIADTEPESSENALVSETIDSPGLTDGEWYFHARVVDNAGNWSAAFHIGPFKIDTNNIQPPSNLVSDTHVTEEWSMENIVGVGWTPVVDDLSGLSGYSIAWDHQPDTIPDAVKSLEADAVYTLSPELPDGGNHWFHIRAADNAGNWSKAASHLGPFYVDVNSPSSVTGLASTSHQVGEWSRINVVRLVWEPAVDMGAGLGGYAAVLDSAASTVPDPTVNVTPEATDWVSEPLDDGEFYFHIRPVDKVGIWSESATHIGPLLIDTIPPSAVSDLESTSHDIRSWSNVSRVSVTWQSSSDESSKGMGDFPHSGLAGYSVSWDSSPESLPDEDIDLDSTTTIMVSDPLPDGNSHYFHIRPVDEAGNWGDVANLGPFYIDTTPPESVSIYKIEEALGERVIHVKGETLYCRPIESAIFTVDVAGEDAGSGLKEASFPDCVSPGTTVTDESDDPNYSYSHQYEVTQDSTFHGPVDISVYDNAGNSSAATFDIALDTVGPYKPANVECDGGAAWNNTGEVTVTWEGEGDDGSGVLDYYAEPNNDQPTANPGGGDQTVVIPVDDGEAIAFYVRGLDNVGNWGEVGSATIGVDTKSPGTVGAISDTDPDANPGYDNDSQIDFSWQPVTDNIRVDHYEVHLSVDVETRHAVSLQESTEQNSYAVPGEDGHSYSVKVMAVDPAGNRGALSEPSETIACDMSPPSFAVTVIPNPGFYHFMHIGVASSEKLLEEPPTLSVDLGGETAVPLSKLAENVWVGSYSISAGASGTAILTVSGTDLAGNEKIDNSNSFAVETVLARAPARIQSSDEALSLYIPPGTFDRDTVVTITSWGKSPIPLLAVDAKLIKSLEDANLCFGYRVAPLLGPSLSHISAGLDECRDTACRVSTGVQYLIMSLSEAKEWPGDASLLNKAILTMHYGPEMVGRNPGIYEWNSDVSKWEYLETGDLRLETIDGCSVDERAHTISVPIERFGIFGIYSDTEPPQISRISPPDGSILDTSLPEFTARITDNGSGVDLSSLSLMIDSHTVATDKRRMGRIPHTPEEMGKIPYTPEEEDDVVIFTLKRGLTEGRHTFLIVGSDLSGNTFTSTEYSIHVPAWAVVPDSMELLQNYPNPFNPETWIPYKLSESTEVRLRIYNTSGRLIRTLELGRQKPGAYVDKERAIYWDGKNENGEDVSSGVYFYELSATGKFVSVKKMVLAR